MEILLIKKIPSLKILEILYSASKLDTERHTVNPV